IKDSRARILPSRISTGLHRNYFTGALPMRVLQEAVVSEIDSKVLLAALTALKKGDFTVRWPLEWTGMAGKVADTFNDVVELKERMAKELDRVRRVVGIEGKLNQRASLGDVGGS